MWTEEKSVGYGLESSALEVRTWALSEVAYSPRHISVFWEAQAGCPLQPTDLPYLKHKGWLLCDSVSLSFK